MSAGGGPAERPRILAIDPGERRVGLAVSDPLGITAQGLPTFDRRGGDWIEHVRALVADYGVARVVMGHPRALSGRDTAATRLAEEMAAVLSRELGLPVEMWDERLSSAEASRTLRGTRARKGAVDRLAAVLILQGYLDAHGRDA